MKIQHTKIDEMQQNLGGKFITIQAYLKKQGNWAASETRCWSGLEAEPPQTHRTLRELPLPGEPLEFGCSILPWPDQVWGGAWPWKPHSLPPGREEYFLKMVSSRTGGMNFPSVMSVAWQDLLEYSVLYFGHHGKWILGFLAVCTGLNDLHI